jgi:hypothetical protein
MWKSAPVTIGMLVAAVIAVATIIGFAYSGQKEIKTVVSSQIKQHCDKDIDRAHPDLPKRYVTKQELNNALHSIDNKLYRITINVEELAKSMKRLQRSNRNGR